MTTIPMYTIGYGNRSIQDFIALLHRYEIQYLVDIRSQPYSRFNPDYSQKALQQHLKQHGIGYIFMGKELGGKPEDSSLYSYKGGRAKGKSVDYDKLVQTEEYKTGIARINNAWNKQFRIVIMCSELKPTECHRGKWVSDSLTEKGIEVVHIDETGEIRAHKQVQEDLAVDKNGQMFLFDQLNKRKHFSRKTYSVSEEEE